MSDKRSKKSTTKTKKISKNKKALTIKLDNGVEIPAKAGYMKGNTKYYKISDISVDNIRVSDGKLYSKKHNSYKHYVFYEHDNEYIPLRIILKDVVGHYNA